jgi:hypothetical protein
MSENNHYALFGESSVQNLEANQRGRLTPEQQSALEVAMKGQREMIGFLGMIILAFVGFFVFFFWQVAGVDGLLSSTSLITIGLVILGVTLLFLVVLGPLIVISHDEIDNGQVESTIGRVVWTGRRYKFVSDSRKLQSMRNGRVLPPPGDYRLYYLSHSGLVVVAQELMLTSASQPKDLLLDALTSANHFSMDDLETNRKGSLSGRQEVRLFGYASMLGGSFLAFILLTIAAAQSKVASENLLVYIFLVIMALVMFLRLGWGSIKVIWDIWNGKVTHMDGQVTRHIRRARNTRYYLYQLNDIKFNVSLSAYNALIEGQGYRVYFTPRAKRLVAIEPLN